MRKCDFSRGDVRISGLTPEKCVYQDATDRELKRLPCHKRSRNKASVSLRPSVASTCLSRPSVPLTFSFFFFLFLVLRLFCHGPFSDASNFQLPFWDHSVGIAMAVSSGDPAPLVGHNAFLRWSAIREVSWVDAQDGERKFWSEKHVSEDFDLALRLQVNAACA